MKPFAELSPDEIEQSMPYWFERQVEKSGDRVAIKSRNYELTYRALNQAANRLARGILAGRGQGEEPIALLFEEDAPMIVAMLGVWKAGKFYAPLSPVSPPARNRYLLSDSEARVLVTNNRNLSLALALTDQVLNVDDLEPGLPEGDPQLAMSPDTKVHLVYTSGSTGQPKGILSDHRRLLHEVITYANSFRLCADDRVLQLHALGFGGASKPVFASLLSGATLFLYDVREQGLDNLARWMLQEEITAYTSVTTAFRHFMGTLNGQERFPELRAILVGGDPLYKADVELYREHFPSTCILINEMATSETGKLLQYHIGSTTQIEDNVIPVGYPLPDMDVRLVNEAGEPVGAGEVGEIAVRSRYLALGYWRKPELTQAAFRPDPMGRDARTYYTGDFGRMRPDGSIEFLGRKDCQVKISGHRVEVAETEMALLDHPAVKEAAVAAGEDRYGDKRLVAYIVSHHQPRPTGAELRSWLRRTLPDYMIPSRFVALDALPLTPTGKVDRARLAAPEEQPEPLAEGSAEPRNDVEHRLTQIWASLFELPSVGLKDDFFQLGGDSLIATSLFIEIERTFGKKLPAATLIQAPTVEQLADALRQAGPSVDGSPVILQASGSKPPFFLVHFLSGTIIGYRELVSLLGSERPIYGLQPKGQAGGEAPHSHLEDMAAHHIRAMRAVQPVGPYYLGGYCYSGIVAFEIARQLETQGEQVALLAVIDAAIPPRVRLRPPIWHPRFAMSFLRNLPHWLKDNLPGRYRMLLSRTLIRLWGKARARWRTLNGRPVAADGRALLEDFMGDLSRFPEGRRQMMAAQTLAFRTYQPQVYHGRLTLFRVRALPLTLPCDPETGWGRFVTGGVDVKLVAGAHHNLLQRPHVDSLAAQLKASLAR